MKVTKLSDYIRGWIIGNFTPSLIKTKQFEVGILSHKKGEDWPEHYHKVATEYNVLLEGSMNVNGRHIYKGDVFVIEKNETSKPTFFEDCTVLVVKIPSIPGDKYKVV